MDDYVKIQVPDIIDNPIVGRCSSRFPLTFKSDYVIIRNGLIGCKHTFESRPKKLIKINDIEKILVFRRKLSCWTSDHKIDPWARSGTEIEISLIYKTGEKQVIVPPFLLVYAEKDWNWFMHELCDSTDLPLEEILETSKKK